MPNCLLISITTYISKQHYSSKRAVDVKKVNKGTRGMPRLSEAMKDVISCDKLRVLANAI